jgi:hypothetical protein
MKLVWSETTLAKSWSSSERKSNKMAFGENLTKPVEKRFTPVSRGTIVRGSETSVYN